MRIITNDPIADHMKVHLRPMASLRYEPTRKPNNAPKICTNRTPPSAARRYPPHRPQIGRHPDQEGIAAPLRAGGHQRDFNRGPQIRSMKGRKQVGDPNCRTSALAVAEDFGLVNMAADPKDEDCRRQADRK